MQACTCIRSFSTMQAHAHVESLHEEAREHIELNSAVALQKVST